LAALLKTFQHERESLRGQLIEVDLSAHHAEQLVQRLEHSAGIAEVGPIHTIQEVPHAIQWRALAPECTAVMPWKDGGVYLITGGAGALGLLFAKDIVAQARRCSLVLLGRSVLSADTEQQLHALRQAGAASVQYHQVDVTDASALEDVVRQTLQSSGQLNGVLHAAGVIHDGVIQNKTAESFESVLRPKVVGTVNLDTATSALKLDLFVLFSSGAGAWGNAGQVDYATANAFMDHFSDWRSEQVSAGLRSGLTLSVNWPLWKEGGMQVDLRTQERMKKSIGAVPLESQAGLSAFYLGIGSGFSRIAVMQGDPVRLRAAGFGAAAQETVKDPSGKQLLSVATDPSFAHSQSTLRHTGVVQESSTLRDLSVDELQASSQSAALRCQWIHQHLVQLLCQALGVKPSELDDKRDLSSYGLDSIVVLDINNRLNKTFSDVPQTLFFEYSRLSELVDYFLRAHGKEIDQLMAPLPLARVAGSPQVAQSSTPVLTQPLSAVVKNLARPEVSRVQVLSLDEHIKKMDAELNIGGGDRPQKTDVQALEARKNHSPFHSVAAFPQPVPGFSLSRSLVTPESCGVELADMVQRQADIRRVLFGKEPVATFGRVLDLGCGLGTDLIELASAHPGLIGHGLTVSEEDARSAEALIRSRGLQDRVKIIREDNRLHRYQTPYDLVFSIQTMHFLTEYADKQALFGKLSRALDTEGRLLMAEYVCTLAEPMRDPVLKVSVHTAQQWARLLGESGLVLTEVIDLSAEVIHFLHDPDLEQTIATLEPARADEVRKLGQQIVALKKGWVRFCLLKVTKAPALHSEVLTERNALLMDRAQSYAAAFGEIQEQTQGSAYAAVLQRFPEFLQTARGAS
jgi:NADP-dependent 3-hydroxy acid dehydrogenase YdfG/aryl carrier-like protein/trans-aconitate methyltransferase